MATKFQKGEMVKLVVEVPTGEVKALRMLEDGTVQCLLEWAAADGVVQQRWFDEDTLTAV